jgi:hypothetical protein
MRRVLAYFEHKAAWWVERGDAEGRKVSPELAEGLRSYSEDQAQLQRDLASNFSAKWEALRREGITQEELDRLARVMEASDQFVQEDDELDGAETGSEEEGFNSADEDDADMTDDDAVGEGQPAHGQ